MPVPGKTFFGHPAGLSTLFFTEMWERFSYYGMRALLLLFMVATVEKGGLGLEDKTASAIYALYTMFVYLMALPGGWLADRLFGLRKSVFYGGCLITLGHFCLAFPFTETFFCGLLLIVIGTGVLKPNISGMVGELYAADDQAKRDAGFSIFYMGINVGATISPIIVGYLGEKINWHFGFAAAGIGMALGLLQYKLTEKNLGSAGLEPPRLTDPNLQGQRIKRAKAWLLGICAIVIILLILLLTKVIIVNPVIIAQAAIFLIGGCVLLYFVYVLVFEKLDATEKKKIAAVAVFWLGSAVFYAGYEQQGSSLNLFTDRYTDLTLWGFRIPTSWLQSVPPIASIVLAPLFAWLWIWSSRKGLNPSTPVKFSMGLLFMGLGYAVMMGASFIVVAGFKALPTWVITTYVLHTVGEICLYPVGLSAVTKLAPKKLVGQLMGIWFMSLAFGNLVAGLFAGEFDAGKIIADPYLLVNLFWLVVKFMVVAGLIVLIFSKPIRKLMGDIR